MRCSQLCDNLQQLQRERRPHAESTRVLSHSHPPTAFSPKSSLTQTLQRHTRRATGSQVSGCV